MLLTSISFIINQIFTTITKNIFKTTYNIWWLRISSVDIAWGQVDC